MKSNRNYFLVFISIIVAFILFMYLFPTKNIPEGIPNDYYDVIDVINDNHVNLFLYSDDIDFNDDYKYIKVSSLNELIISSNSNLNVLVLDMNKNISREFASEEQIEQLYRFYSFTIMIVNYASSGSSQLDQFIDKVDIGSDLIVFSYDANHNAYSGSYSDEFPSNQMLMYAILDNIRYMIEENSN